MTNTTSSHQSRDNYSLRSPSFAATRRRQSNDTIIERVIEELGQQIIEQQEKNQEQRERERELIHKQAATRGDKHDSRRRERARKAEPCTNR